MLVLIINVYIKIYNSFRCVCWFPRLVLDQRMSTRKFVSGAIVLSFICINPLIAT
jgi:hypothetical protein